MPRRPCDAITMRSQPFSFAVAMVPSAGCRSRTWMRSQGDVARLTGTANRNRRSDGYLVHLSAQSRAGESAWPVGCVRVSVLSIGFLDLRNPPADIRQGCFGAFVIGSALAGLEFLFFEFGEQVAFGFEHGAQISAP